MFLFSMFNLTFLVLKFVCLVSFYLFCHCSLKFLLSDLLINFVNTTCWNYLIRHILFWDIYCVFKIKNHCGLFNLLNTTYSVLQVKTTYSNLKSKYMVFRYLNTTYRLSVTARNFNFFYLVFVFSFSYSNQHCIHQQAPQLICLSSFNQFGSLLIEIR